MLLVAYFGIGWVMVGSAVQAERVLVEITPTTYGLSYDDVTFTPRTDDPRDKDITLYGWWIPAPQSAADPAGNGSRAVIIVHGVDSNRAREPDTFMPVITGLLDAGLGVFLFDLRAHGASDGEIMSAGYFEKRDVLGAVDVLTETYGVDIRSIGVLGYSLGAVAGLLAAADEPRLRSLVMDSPFADVNDLFAKEVASRTPLPAGAVTVLKPGMELSARLRYGIELAEIKPVETITEIDFPVLVIHSEDDDRLPISYSERIVDASTHPSTTFFRAPSGGHSRAYEEHFDEYMDRVTRYFDDTLAATVSN